MPTTKKPTIFLVMAALSLLLIPLSSTQAAKGKKTGYMGSPAAKRGLEYGYYKGFQAGKKDKAEGLTPDPKRHEDFNNPDKYFRVEFGSQGSFVSGFKGGFVGGYQKAFGKKVRINVPELKAQPQGTAEPANVTAEKSVAKPTVNNTRSDAL